MVFGPSFLQCAELKLLLFGGKGGVGKTTCAAATALQLAERFPDRSFLLVSTDPAHSLADSLAGAVPAQNLEHREIDFRASFQRFKDAHAGHFRAIALQGTFLDEEDVQRLLDLSLPGFDELMALTELADCLDRNEYSSIIVDTAPTGHMLRFLEMPGLMRRWVAASDSMLAKHRFLARLYSGTYHQDEADLFLEQLTKSIRRLSELMRDPARCRFVPVMLAETLSRTETARLLARLNEMNIPVTDILVNRLQPTGPECPICSAACSRQQRELRQLVREFADYQLWGIPLHLEEVRGEELLRCFWDGTCPVHEPKAVSAAACRQRPRVDNPPCLPVQSVCLMLFAGKGGVGKTTLACASAVRLAHAFPGRKVLLFSTDPAHSLADCLDVPVGPREVKLLANLSALEIDAKAEFDALRREYLREVEAFFHTLLDRAGADLEFDRSVVQRLLDLSPPGLDEVMALLRVIDLLDAGKYDLFVLDTAPTGHLVRWLELPELIQGWLQAFFGLFLKYKHVLRLPRIAEWMVGVSKKLKRLRSLLNDPARGQLNAVSILTEMAFEETCDLLANCRRVEVPVPVLFLNLASAPENCWQCRRLAETEAPVRSRFAARFADVHQTVVYRWAEPRGLDRLAELGAALYRGNDQCNGRES